MRIPGARDPIFDELDRRIAEEEAQMRKRNTALRPRGPQERPAEVAPETPEPKEELA